MVTMPAAVSSFEGPIDCVDGSVQPAGEQRPAGHPDP